MVVRVRRVVVATLLLMASLRTTAVAAAPGVQFSPQGTVKGVRQAIARFPEAMIRLGDPRAAAPFDVDCAEPGTSRWIDSRTWAHDFARDLPAGVRCSFRLRPDVSSLAGKAVAASEVFSFSTGGPAIRRSVPFEGSKGIVEDQAFILGLDAEADEASVVAHVSFAVDGVRERVGVRVIGGEERDAILKTYRWAAEPPVVIVQATQRFPNGARVALVWGKDVATTTGVTSTSEQRLEFQTRPPFTVSFRCDRERANAPCIPVTPMRVEVSAAITAAQARQVKLLDGKGVERTREREPTDDELVTTITFAGPFEEEAAYTVVLPPDLQDESGRTPVNAARYPLTVKTGPAPPLAKFAARFGIVESKADPTLPVTLRNLEPAAKARVLDVGVKGTVYKLPIERDEDILPWLRRVGFARRERSVFTTADPAAPAPAKGAASGAGAGGSPSAGASPAPQPVATTGLRAFTLPKPEGERAFEVVGIPLGEPGLYVVELESARLGASLLAKPKPMFVPTAALVTNLSVHLKWGEQGSLAWVTTLDAAEPVAGADVTVRDCGGTPVWTGTTDAQGIARIDTLPPPTAVPTCYAGGPPDGDPFDGSQTRALEELFGGVLVTARTADDLGFVHSSWTEGIEAWRYDLPDVPSFSRTVAHTILDRPLFRAGDTVHMKHVLRAQTLRGFALPERATWPVTASIRHVGSGEHHEMAFTWDASGIAESTWTIPRESKLGRYEIHLLGPESAASLTATADLAAEPADGPPPSADLSEGAEVVAYEGGGADDWLSGEVRVEEFRVPAMRGTVSLPAEPQIRPREVAADVAVQYLAGGGASGAPVTLRAQVGPKAMTPPDDFAEFHYANGAVTEGLVRSTERTEDDDRQRIHQRQQLTLDQAGTARATITDLPTADVPQELRTEIEFRDPSGQAQTVASSVPLWPGKRLAAIAPERWAATRERVGARIAVLDVAGAPVPRADVTVDVFQRKTYSNRKRLVGGFYGYDHAVETKRLGSLCSGSTDERGILWCEGPSPVDGEIVLQASVIDDAGNRTAAHAEMFVAGPNRMWFDVADSDRMDVLPETRRYEPGDTARLQVRMPFAAATALVTVEREGIVSANVVRLAGDEPLVELPVDAAWAPNVYVSVLAVRGRVGDVQPTALVDLGKPAFKLGLTELQVGWRAHRLSVRVAADEPAYRVRERAAVKVAVRDADGKPPPAGSEIALAAVDEGLLELLPNRSWDLLAAMMGRRAYGVATATAQMQVVGKRHYGRKAVPAGGGGGRKPTRELFDTLLLWQGRVPLDANGRATVEVPLNDSLTSFRIVAVATGGLAAFGSGATTIRATQDVMLLSGLPPVVREGDRFRAELTARNTTARAIDLTLTARAEGLTEALPPQRVALAAGEARTIGWDVTTPLNVETLRWEIEASIDAGGVADSMKVAQAVRPAVPVRTLQATLVQVEAGLAPLAVARPADALPDRGDVRVALAPFLAAGLDGVREWMRRYPYGCLEQRVSRAIALRDPALWAGVAAALPAYGDGDGLLKYFPNLDRGSEVLTAYVLAVSHEAGAELAEAVRTAAESGLRAFVAGALTTESQLATADLAIRKLAALEALSRRDPIDASLLDSITIEPDLWPTSAVLDWWSILQRTPNVPDRDRRLAQVEQIVRARLTWSGTTIGFSSESTDDLWWLMTNADVNAVRLLLTALEQPAWRDELPRLARGALARHRRGAWSTTVANAWGVVAVEKLAAALEPETVAGSTTVTLPAASQVHDWASAPTGGTLTLPWPAGGTGDLALAHAGSGRPWAVVQTRAAVPLRAPLASGYRITRTVTPLESREPGRTMRGDVVRVRLEIDADSDMTWVVVDDPVPAGASHLGTGLARDASMAAQGGTPDPQGPEPVFAERAFDAFRAYYEHLPRGRAVVEYVIRLNQPGRFALPPTRVEALYAPEMFGELPNEPVEVAP